MLQTGTVALELGATAWITQAPNLLVIRARSPSISSATKSREKRQVGKGETMRVQPQRAAAAAAKLLQSCPTLCDPTDGSPPGSAVLGILQARTLEWVAISFSSA